MPRNAVHCHRKLREVARELAATNYDELMSFDPLYSAWKKQNPGIAGNAKRLRLAFVNRKWGLYVEAARAMLATMLNGPLDEKVKEEIMQVLILDSTLMRGRVAPAAVIGSVSSISDQK